MDLLYGLTFNIVKTPTQPQHKTILTVVWFDTKMTVKNFFYSSSCSMKNQDNGEKERKVRMERLLRNSGLCQLFA